MAERDYTPYQEKVIRQYYANQPALLRQRLADLVGDLYLAEGKKKQQLWKTAAETLTKLGLPKTRVDHLLAKGDVQLLAGVVKELEAQS
jgi:ATP/maltotriose-dependent transcriptional regulator MalT